MSFASRAMRRALAFAAFFLALAFSGLANAGGHGEGGGGPAPMIFTVNLGPENYLQFGLVLEGATPEIGQEVEVYKPKIQHEIILLLSTKDVEHLRTLEGKKELVEEIQTKVNHVIDETAKTGVKEVLFTRFLIQ